MSFVNDDIKVKTENVKDLGHQKIKTEFDSINDKVPKKEKFVDPLFDVKKEVLVKEEKEIVPKRESCGCKEEEVEEVELCEDADGNGICDLQCDVKKGYRIAKYLGDSVLRNVLREVYGMREKRDLRSSSSGFGTQWMYYIDLCYGSQTTVQLLRKLAHQQVFAQELVLNIGCYDILTGRRYKNLNYRYRCIMSKLRAKKVERVIILTPIPLPRFNRGQMCTWYVLCLFTEKLAKKYPQITVIETASHFLLPNGKVNESLFLSDGILPNREGLRLLGSLIPRSAGASVKNEQVRPPLSEILLSLGVWKAITGKDWPA